MEHPKVRFSQSCNKLETEQTDNEAKNMTCTKGQIKVKSIVPTNFPIKVLDNGQRVIIKDKNHEFDTKKCMPTSCVPSLLISKAHSPVKQFQCKSTTINNESDMSSSDMDSCTHDLQKMNIGGSFQNVLSSNVIANTTALAATSTNIDSNNDIKLSGAIDTPINSKMKKNSKQTQISSVQSKDSSDIINGNDESKWSMSNFTKRANKENRSKSIKVKSVQNKSLNTVLRDSRKLSTGTTTRKFNKSPKPMELMPSAKFKLSNSTAKNKKLETQVKKSTVFHVEGKATNVLVEAGTLPKDKDTYTDIINHDKRIISNDLLSRPEYNSIIGVIKNLKEIEKEKLVKDYEHLPKIYQNFVSGKITSALDFSPYESVYKDLIDLSIDDDKLPTRVFRSKDPEPRDKDIVPKLSDFYNPKYTEQHFITVNTKPLNPINLNTLNASTISGKVCSWKICRDNF